MIGLKTITPGTETVTLVTNGDFESGTGNTTPTACTRVDDSFFDKPTVAALTGFSNLPSSGKAPCYTTVEERNHTTLRGR